jgi:hypothetical protein
VSTRVRRHEENAKTDITIADLSVNMTAATANGYRQEIFPVESSVKMMSNKNYLPFNTLLF